MSRQDSRSENDRALVLCASRTTTETYHKNSPQPGSSDQKTPRLGVEAADVGRDWRTSTEMLLLQRHLKKKQNVGQTKAAG